MQSITPKSKMYRAALAGFLVLFSLSLIAICLLPISFHVKNLPDDGFYYLVLSRNLAEGQGPTFDGITRTNGFHPLWAFALATLYRTVPHTPMGDIRIALSIGLLCHFLTGAVLLLTFHRIGAGEHGLLGGVLYWLNPYAFLRSLGGMEPALYALLLALLFYLLARSAESLRDPTCHLLKPVTIGFVAGLTILARTDAILLLPLVALFVFVPRLRPARICWRAALYLLTGAVIAMLPWILYSWEQFGTVWQYSGLIKNHARQLFLSDRSIFGQAGAVAANFIVWIRKSIVTVPLLKYILIGVLLTGWRWSEWRSWTRSIPRLIWIYLGFVGLAGLYYAAGYNQIRGWYIVPASITMSILSVHALHHLPSARRLWAWLPARHLVMVLLVVECLLYPVLRLGRGINREQTDMYAMVEWAGSHLPTDRRIGAFNAGIAAYFLANPVVNLDGLMNNEILDVVRRRNMGRYLDDREIRYILDQEWVAAAMRDLGGEEWFADRVRVWHRMRGPEKGIEMILWEIEPADAADDGP